MQKLAEHEVSRGANKGLIRGSIIGSALGAVAGAATIPYIIRHSNQLKNKEGFIRNILGFTHTHVPLSKKIYLTIEHPMEYPPGNFEDYVRKQIKKAYAPAILGGTSVGATIGSVLGTGVGAAHGAMEKKADDRASTYAGRGALLGLGAGAIGGGAFGYGSFNRALKADNVTKQMIEDESRYTGLVPIFRRYRGPKKPIYTLSMFSHPVDVSKNFKIARNIRTVKSALMGAGNVASVAALGGLALAVLQNTKEHKEDGR